MYKNSVQPHTPKKIGIIGGGFASLMAYSVLRFRGVAAEDIVVFSSDISPEDSWLRFVRAIHQNTMRSESIAHFFPTDSPGLATVEAVRDWSIKPLVQSWFDRYRPSVETMVEHAKTVAQTMSFHTSLQKVTISGIEKDPTTGVFLLRDDQGNTVSTVQHLIVAIGHGPLAVPQPIEEYMKKYPDDARVQHAFSQIVTLKSNETVVILGDGLTSGTLWANVLRVGGSVVAVSRDGFSFGQSLNTPRRYFSQRGIGRYIIKTNEERMAELKRATRGTIPMYGEWKDIFEQALDDGRLVLVHGNLEYVGHHREKLIAGIRWPDRPELFSVSVDRVISATGFLPVTQHPLIKHLIDTHKASTVGSYLEVANSAQVLPLSTPDNTVSVIGPAAAWAIPCADSLGGMKIAAHRIAESIVGKESWNAAELWQKTMTWMRMISGKKV